MSEREDFDAWFQRRYSCSNFNGSWEATAAMGHAWNGWQERARRTVSERETKYARDLAVSLHRQHYSEEAPQWEPFDDLYGILTQIDNMTVGLRRTVSGQEAVARYDLNGEFMKRSATGEWIRFDDAAPIRPSQTDAGLPATEKKSESS